MTIEETGPCSATRHAWAPLRDDQIENLQWCWCGQRQWYNADKEDGQGYQIEVVVDWPDRAPTIFREKTKSAAIARAHSAMEASEAPICIRARGRYVGEWEDIANFQYGTAPVPRGFVLRYTNAPDAYFGFNTHVLAPTGRRDRDGMNSREAYRKVAVDVRYKEWQHDRNASGGYQTLDQDQWVTMRAENRIV